MPSTHLSLHVHLIFSTKDRVQSIHERWRSRLHAFLGGAVREAGCVPEAIGGVADHAHLLVGLPATVRLSDIMREVKAGSSRWVHEEVKDPTFAWQEGYGAFSVSASQRAYIERQEEHHRKRTFQEEYEELLRRAGVAYDPKHLW